MRNSNQNGQLNKRQTVNTLNRNNNNSTDNDRPDNSDWEDFNLHIESDLDEESVENAATQPQMMSQETIKMTKSRNNGANEDNFELVSSGEEELSAVSRRPQLTTESISATPLEVNCNAIEADSQPPSCQDSWRQEPGMPYHNAESVSGSCLIGGVRSYISTVFHFLVWIIILPFLALRDFPNGIKHYTNTSSLSMALVKVVPYVIKDFITFMKQFCPCKLYKKFTSSCPFKKAAKNNANSMRHLNSNNNAIYSRSSDSCEPINNTMLCFYIFIFSAAIVAFFSYCWFHPESKICSVNEIVMELKLKLIELLNDLYILPGEDCMKAGRCCKGFLEALFRWWTCLATITIRAALTAWPRNPDTEHGTESIDSIKMMVDKIITEIGELKERTNKLEEMMLKLRTQLTHIEKIIAERSHELHKMEPVVRKYWIEVQQLRKDVNSANSQVRNVISIRAESDRIIEAMKVTARDASTSIKAAISKLQSSIEAEQNRLQTQIELLESLVKEDDSKLSELNERHLNRVMAEVEFVKISQDEIKVSLKHLKDLPTNYKKLSDIMKRDVKAKLAEDLLVHDQMSKKTECACMKRLSAFKDDLERSKSMFSCYVESRIEDKTREIEKNVKQEVGTNFYDRTVEIAKATAEEAISYHVKHHTTGTRQITQAGMLTDMGDGVMQPLEENCATGVDAAQLLDYEAMCMVHNRSSSGFNTNETLETEPDSCLSRDQIKKLVRMAVARYSADNTGLADFALESMGGSVVPSSSSPTYNGRMSILAFFSIPVARITNSMRTIIQPGNKPGDCWPFRGSSGHAVVKLAHTILVKAVTLDHLPSSLSPGGRLQSAPRRFNVTTLTKSNEDEHFLGTFEYEMKREAIQTFWIEKPRVASSVKLTVLDNHGSPEYTCIYRFRVHGTLAA